MKQIWTMLHQRRALIGGHPFFHWLRSDLAPLEARFLFSPVMLDFIMGFSDINKWFFSYEEPANALEDGINEHTEEDRQHSRLFVDNWQKLGLDRELRWNAGKTLWWLYLARETAPTRHFGMQIMELASQHRDARLRFCLMEAIEVCGTVFFSHTAPVANELERKYGAEHFYYGPYHLARETGHLHTNESAFFAARLTEAERKLAEHCVNCIFDGFVRVLDELLAYSKRATAAAGELALELEAERAQAFTGARSGLASAQPPLAQPAGPRCARQLALVRALDSRRERLFAHPFFSWLSGEQGPTAREKLCRFMPLWAVDIVGYKDFCTLALSYRDTTSLAERALNYKAEQAGSHGVLFLEDWNALGLDERLSWSALDTVTFCFLNDATEVHRKNLARVTRFAFEHSDVAVRSWLLRIFEACGDPLFACTSPLALEAEKQFGGRLNYWAGRHYLTHTAVPDPVLAGFDFLDVELSEAQFSIIDAMITQIFDGFEEQYALSHRVALGDEIAGCFRPRPKSFARGPQGPTVTAGP